MLSYDADTALASVSEQRCGFSQKKGARRKRSEKEEWNGPKPRYDYRYQYRDSCDEILRCVRSLLSLRFVAMRRCTQIVLDVCNSMILAMITLIGLVRLVVNDESASLDVRTVLFIVAEL